MSTRTPAVLIGMDATEVTFVEQLLSEGRLPNLQHLRDRGRFGKLQSSPPEFLSMVWPTFHAGRQLSQHGWYFNKLWRHDRQRLEYVSPEWLPQRPFWESIDPSFRIALLDLPFASRPTAPINGVFLNGWQNHDDFGQYSHPPDLLRDLRSRFGRPVLRPEWFGHQSPTSLMRLRQEMIDTNDQFGRLCAGLLSGYDWDLFITVFGGAHRGSHYLWDLSQIDTTGVAPEKTTLLQKANAELYESTDRALGMLMDALPEGARIMVFALHGMGPNPGWSEYFARIVSQIHNGDSGEGQKPGLVYRAKKALPWKLARQITTRLPTAVNHAVVPIWSRRMHDWSTTRFFALPLDLNGYVRINLKGREAEGIVEPGTELQELYDELEEAFLSFVDIESGKPFASSVIRVDDLVGPDAPCRSVLPDLVVSWSDLSAFESTGVRSPDHGEVRWERGARFPSGRSGNHLGQGWYVAVGDGIEPGRSETIHDTVDLLPTVYSWIGAETPSQFEGQPIPELVG